MRLRGDVLFVELLGGLGDVLIALPAIRALARSHPEARVEVLTLAPGSALLQGDPEVGAVHVPLPGEPPAAAVARLLGSRRWAAVVSDTAYEGIDALVAGADAPVRVGNLWRRPPDDQLIERRFVRLLHADGLVADEHADTPAALRVDPADRAWARAWLGGGRWAVLVPEAGMAIKRWPAARWAALARRLADEHSARVLAVADAEPPAPAVLAAGAVAAPRVGLRRLAALLAEVDLCVAGDTGPARVAAAAGTPTVALFGPTWAGRFGLPAPHVNVQSPLACPVRHPPNMTEQTCWWSGRCAFSDRASCVEEIGVEEVAAAAGALLRR